MPRYKPILERFHEKYVINDATECWEWQGATVGIGYGVIGGERGGKSIPAHRFSYSHYIGPIQDGHVICHRCDNPCCVNPTHLYAADHHTNMREMAQKGRARSLSRDEVEKCIARATAGESLSAIARDVGVARMTVTRAIRLAEQNGDYGGTEARKGSRYYTILSEDDKSAILHALAEDKMSIMRIAKIFNVDRKTVRNLRDGNYKGRYTKLTLSEVKEIIAFWEAGMRQHEIAGTYGIDQTHVSRIVRGKAWEGVKSTAKLPRSSWKAKHKDTEK